MGKNGNRLTAEGFALLEFAEYGEARALASRIAGREERHQDAVFSEAMHVAAVLALEEAELPYTRPNIAWMFERIQPSEVLAILQLRLERPDEYADLPMAHATDAMTVEAVEAAMALANGLTQEELDAFFFSDAVGTA
jgi:hypothetical protein